MVQKCPLCGGMIGNGVCLSCNYKIPDEDSIAAPYNYDPEDYAQQGSSVQKNADEENGSSDRGEMDTIGIPSADNVSEVLAPKPEWQKNAVKYRPEPKDERENTFPPPVYNRSAPSFEQPEEEQQGAFDIFVQGFVYEVKRHWWKALLILFVPVSAIFIGAFYLINSGGVRRYRFQPVDPAKFDFKAFGIGILYFAIGLGLMIEQWDPLGLNKLILSFFGN